MKPSMKCLAALILLTLVASVATAFAEPSENTTAPNKTEATAKPAWLAEMVAEREKLVSGEYYIDGTITYEGWDAPQTVSLHSWFDYDSALFRYDATLPTPGKERERPNSTSGILIRRPDFDLSTNRSESRTYLEIKVAGKGEPFPDFWRPDIRAIGLALPISWLTRLVETPGATKLLLEGKLVSEVTSLDGSTSKTIWLTRHPSQTLSTEGLGQEMWFDHQNHHVPTKVIFFAWKKDADGNFDSNSRRTLGSMTIEWREQNSVAVPGKMSISEDVYANTRLKKEYDLRLTWKSVNTLIPTTNFDPDTRNMPMLFVPGQKAPTPAADAAKEYKAKKAASDPPK
jgi:hypothetical protein